MTLSTTLAKTLKVKSSSIGRYKGKKDHNSYLSTFSTAGHFCKLFKRLVKLCLRSERVWDK